MLSNATLFLARRYLRARRSFVSVITIISILGVAVGVLMMIVVSSVMKGFEGEFRKVLIGSEPHILLHPQDKKPADARSTAEILAKVRAQPEVLAASSYISSVMYAEHDGMQSGMDVLGLPQDGAKFYMAKISRHKLEGSLDLTPGGLVCADYVAGQLNAHPGDRISVYASSNVTSAVKRFRIASDEQDETKRHAAYEQIKLHPKEISVQGTTRTESAGAYGYVTLETAQQIFGFGDQVSGVLIELKRPDEVKDVITRFTAAGLIPAGWSASLWTDAGDARLAAMSNERVMMWIVLLIIAVVAAFSVMNTTITVTTQKRREIGVLTALGSRQGQIIGIFVSQAAFVGTLGTLLGLVLSGLVLRFRDDIRMGIAVLSGGSTNADSGMFLATIPAQIEPWFIAVTCLGSITLCLLAALPPAWLAARVDPAVALRD
ncbi:FtsX-like permease family protein [Prosthecobacter vanneervenii]|uniref:Lipoprotein-releasing system permease protein n=1 Tax=Prosthecobacter vanneervenii TaxID=48466 RepID=A0A7W7YEK5_9BACT|nr:FtsX-like permease family protein [Prosthecobacter vanneervenii]MBB5034747.1 lipoprotein-releasing system permease protein [Prosthecobacter vanneervenii]